MQKGHMRFEPNINTVLTLSDGRVVKTPIVEIKNLNSFKALKGAIDYEHAEQPARWRREGKVMGPGAKSTRGWDDVKNQTVLQREKEDAHDYRYFPDPDLVPVRVDAPWLDAVRARLPELPHQRARRYADQYALSAKEAAALTDERDVCLFYESIISDVRTLDPSISEQRAGKQAANMVLQSGAKRANERAALVSALGVTPRQVAQIIVLREADQIGSTAADELFGLLCDDRRDALDIAREKNLLQVRDEGALDAWCRQAIDDPANEKSVADIRGGKLAAIGRLTGAVMKLSGGAADAKAVQAKLKEVLGIS
jgi:aspartyl-tRNA(Asn)/glutamyl-tRNA(Gln) amidotransferase subunit B